MKARLLVAVLAVLLGLTAVPVKAQFTIPNVENVTKGMRQLRSAEIRHEVQGQQSATLKLTFTDGSVSSCLLDGSTDVVIIRHDQVMGTWVKVIPADPEWNLRPSCVIVVRTKVAERTWNRILIENGFADVIPTIASR
jgi:hypothetical protein